MSRALTAVVALAALALGGCTVKKTEAPPLAGPSEFGLSVRTSVTPDILTQDGLSQSVIEIVARGPDGRPQRAVPFRVEITVNGVAVDYGRLSSRNPVTGDDGIARLTYTAPPAPPEPVDTFTVVTLNVTPIGGDFNASNTRFVDVRLVPPGVIIPPNGAPVPSFIVTPTPVTTITPVTFDASATKDEGSVCGAACSYAWNFGDGSSGSGVVVTHEFRAPGTYVVRLTVIDVRGQSATTAQSIVVEQTAAPKADFVFSPSAPLVSQQIFFNASASTAAPGHKIVSYDWDFGSGRTATGLTVAKGYETAGTYRVTLVVTDDTFSPGGTATVTKDVTVRTPTP